MIATERSHPLGKSALNGRHSPLGWATIYAICALLIGSTILIVMFGPRYAHETRWQTENAEIIWIKNLCNISYKPFLSRTKQLIDTIECDKTKEYLASLPLEYSSAHSASVVFAGLTYPALQGGVIRILQAHLPSGIQDVGQQFVVLVNPTDPRDIDAPMRKDEVLQALIVVIAFVGLVFVFGYLRELGVEGR